MRHLWVYKFEEKKIMKPSFAQRKTRMLNIDVEIQKKFGVQPIVDFSYQIRAILYIC